MAYSLKNDIWHFLRYNEEKITVKSDEASEGRQKYTIWSPNNIRHIIILNGFLYAILYCKYANYGYLIKGSLGITNDETAKTVYSNNDYILSAILKSGVQSSAVQTNILSGLESISIIDSRNGLITAEHNYLVSYIANNKDTMGDKYPRLRNIVLAVTPDIDLRSSIENIISGYSSSGGIKTEDICQPIIKLIEANGGRAISNYIAENHDWYKNGVTDSLGRNPKWYVFDEDDGSLHKMYTIIYNAMNKENKAKKMAENSEKIASDNTNRLRSFLKQYYPIMLNWRDVCTERFSIEAAFTLGSNIERNRIKSEKNVSVHKKYINETISKKLFDSDGRHNQSLEEYIKDIDFEYLRYIVYISDLEETDKQKLSWLCKTFEASLYFMTHNYAWTQIQVPNLAMDFSDYIEAFKRTISSWFINIPNIQNLEDKRLFIGMYKGVSKSLPETKRGMKDMNFILSSTPSLKLQGNIKTVAPSGLSIEESLMRLGTLVKTLMTTEMLSSYIFFVQTMNLWHTYAKVDARTLKIIQRSYCPEITTEALCPISVANLGYLDEIMQGLNIKKDDLALNELYNIAKDIGAIAVCPEGNLEQLSSNFYGDWRIRLGALNKFYFYLAGRYLISQQKN